MPANLHPSTQFEETPGLTFPEYFSASSLSDAQNCERLWAYHYLRRLRPRVRSIHLIAGGAFAAGTEAYRRYWYSHVGDHEGALASAFQAAADAWGDYVPPFPTNKSFDRIVSAIDTYFTSWYPAATDPVQPYQFPAGQLGIECSFAVPLDILHPETGKPLLIAGRADMLGVFQNQLFLVDEKTTTQLGASWGTKWDLRGQFSLYCWAVGEVFGQRPAGVIVRGISFLKDRCDTAEVIAYRPDWLLMQWLEKTRHLIQRLIDVWRTAYALPAFDDACTNYGGCSFLSACTKQDPEPWLAQDFEQRDRLAPPWVRGGSS
jgi:hypothetical protein